MDDESGESMQPIEEVPLVELGESELERLVRSWRREAGSWFQRRGEAYWKERSVIRREDDGYGLLLYKRFFITLASKNFKMQKNEIFFLNVTTFFCVYDCLKRELFRITGAGFYRPDAQLSLKRDTSYWLSTDQYTHSCKRPGTDITAVHASHRRVKTMSASQQLTEAATMIWLCDVTGLWRKVGTCGPS